MSETPEDRPRPTPRPRPGAAAARPSPRPRVAGSRRDRAADGTADPAAGAAQDTAITAATPPPRPRSGDGAERAATTPARPAAARRSDPLAVAADSAPRRRLPVLALALAVLCALAAVAGGLLLHQRLDPPYVDASVFAAARTGVQDLYAYDYKDSKGSVARKLAVLTGQLHDQYQKDLSQGGIIDTYQQVSATTSFDVVDVGLVQVDDAQNSATVVVFGQYKVTSVNSGTQPAPQGSECTVTADGAQSCTQTVQLHEVKAGGSWKIDDLSLKTTS
jgi:hypothetical protein